MAGRGRALQQPNGPGAGQGREHSGLGQQRGTAGDDGGGGEHGGGQRGGWLCRRRGRQPTSQNTTLEVDCAAAKDAVDWLLVRRLGRNADR